MFSLFRNSFLNYCLTAFDAFLMVLSGKKIPNLSKKISLGEVCVMVFF